MNANHRGTEKARLPAETTGSQPESTTARNERPQYTTDSPGAQTAAADVLRAALEYAARGWYVFPCSRDKKPLTAHSFYDATTDAEQITRWWTQHPNAAIGVACGKSGLFVVDIDVKRDDHNGFASWEALGIHDVGLVSLTPSRGKHIIYYANGHNLGNSVGRLGPGLDTRGDGGYIIVPPSSIETGEYRAVGDWTEPPPPVPEALVALLTAPRAAEPQPQPPPQPPPQAQPPADREKNWARAALEGEYKRVASAQQRTRNDTLNRAAFALGQIVGAGLLDRREVESALYAAACACGLVTDDGERSVNATIKSGLTAGVGQPRWPRAEPLPAVGEAAGWSDPLPPGLDELPPPPDDVPDDVPDEGVCFCDEPTRRGAPNRDKANAFRLARLYGNKLRYTQQAGWLVWDGTRWARDELGFVHEACYRAAISIYDEAEQAIREAKLATIKATEAGDEGAARAAAEQAARAEKRATDLLAWAPKSQDANRLAATERLARSVLPLATKLSSFDQADYVLNLPNCTLDLETGRAYPHRQSDMITKIAGAPYDPQATCPLWVAFLERVLNRDAELIAFVRRAVGYSLTGATDEQCLFFLYGDGANGKSTFVETLRALLGEYSRKTQAETLLAKSGSRGIPNDVAALAGARVVVASELTDRRLDEGLVKDLTGGDTICARFLYQELFEFKPTFKLWMYGNRKPAIRGTDDGIWRRIRLIPFVVQIPEAERDPQLPRKLQRELSGILNWALAGYDEWRRIGLGVPAAVRTATAAYRESQDVIGQFIAECCVVSKNARATRAELYNAYTTWCDTNQERALGTRALCEELRRRGFEEQKSDGIRGWRGIGLLATQ